MPNQLITTLWGTRTAKVITVIGGTIAAVFTAITAAHTAWPIIEPAVPAHRGFVIEKVGNVQATTNELLIWKNEDSKAKVDSDIAGWSIQLQKEQEPQTRNLIQRQIEQLKQNQQQIDDRIKKLRGN